jgi:hypothetical protein
LNRAELYCETLLTLYSFNNTASVVDAVESDNSDCGRFLMKSEQQQAQIFNIFYEKLSLNMNQAAARCDTKSIYSNLQVRKHLHFI